MSTNQMRLKPLMLESISRSGASLTTNYFRFGFCYERMNTFCITPLKPIWHIVNTAWDINRLLRKTQSNNMMLTLASQGLNNMNILTRKILMNEQKLQGKRSQHLTLRQ